MTTKIGLIRIAVILLFIIAFTVVGWAAPAMYATHAPEGQFIEVHSFEAQNTTVGSDYHHICLDRTVKQSVTGTTFAELYLISDDGEKIRMYSESDKNYFHEGRQTILEPYELPSDLVEGEYRYMMVIEMNVANDQVTREFTYTSDTFHIDDSEENVEEDFDCE